MANQENESPDLDVELAARVMGKDVLIGLTYLSSTGDVTEQKQLHGIVEQASADSGVVIRSRTDRSSDCHRTCAESGTHRPAHTGSARRVRPWRTPTTCGRGRSRRRTREPFRHSSFVIRH
jgi:hypothetical protein